MPAVQQPAATPDNTKPADDGYDAFSSAFDSLVLDAPAQPTGESNEGDKATPAGAAPSSDPAAVKPDASTSSGDASGDSAPAAADGTAPAGTSADSKPEGASDAGAPAAEGDKPAAQPAPEKDWKAEAERLAAENEALRAKPSTPKGDTGEAPKADTPADPPKAAPVYTDEEQQTVTAYQKEWPDVAKGEALVRRSEYRELVGYIFNEMNRVYGPALQRAMQTVDTFEDDYALRAIKSTHSDYSDAMADQVAAWAEGLKGFRGHAARAVIKEGTPEEVADLITEYKREKGITTQPAGQTPAAPVAPAAPATVTELSSTAKKAATAMGVVDSKRGAQVASAPDKDDFDSAWNEAVATR